MTIINPTNSTDSNRRSKANMLKSLLFAGAATLALSVSVNHKDQTLTASADEVSQTQTSEQSTSTTSYTVVGGDTLNKIAQANGVDVDTLVSTNNIQNRNLIYVGQVIQIPTSTNTSAASQPVTTVTETQSATTAEQPSQAATTNTGSTSQAASGGNYAEIRKGIESGGNYNTNTGNGYLGAYQFAPQTIAGIEAATGMSWSMSPETQDAFANYYAQSRYGGWQNVPTTGGW